MSPKCCIRSCSPLDAFDEPLQYFKLPVCDNVQRAAWVSWIQTKNGDSWTPGKCVFLCSRHFRPECRGLKKLKKGSVPSDFSVDNRFRLSNEERETNQSCHGTGEDPDKEFSTFGSNLKNGAIPSDTFVDNQDDVGTSMCRLPREVNETNQSCHWIGDDRYKEFSAVVEIDINCETKSDTRQDKITIQNDDNAGVCLRSVTDHIALPIQPSNGILTLHVVNGQVITNRRIEEWDTKLSEEIEETPIWIGNDVAVEELCSNTVILTDEVDETQIIENDIAVDELHSTEQLQSLLAANGNPLTSNPLTTKDRRKPHRKCSALDCTNPQGSFFAFPTIIRNGTLDQQNINRCKLWIQNAGNLQLLEKASSDLCKQNFLCSLHFEEQAFFNKMRKRLRPDAVPTVFSTLPLDDEKMTMYPIHNWRDVEAELLQDVPHNENNERLDEYQKKFSESLNSLEWRVCKKCKAKFFCKKDSKQNCVYSKRICDVNSALVLDEIPDELKDLTFIEEQLIAKIHPIVTVIKLKQHQLGYKGNVINFPQDISGFAKVLPHKVDELSCVLTIRASKDLKPVDFQVRAQKVRNALMWLKNNNKHYFDVEISEQNLDLLPDDENVFDLVTGIEIEEDLQTSHALSEEPRNNTTESVPSEENNNMRNSEDYEEDIYESGSPIMTKATGSDQISSILSWPTIGNEPVNEFDHDTYIVQAFPCLFPKGNGNLKVGKNRMMSAINYFKYLMRYYDDRFARHNRFRYFALNSYMRWSALTNGNLFIKTKPEFQQMTLTDLKEKLEKDPSFIKKIMYRNSSISGTKAYWFARGKELLNMVEQLGLPTLFFTLSAADLHWPELFKLLAPDEDYDTMTDYRRRQLVKSNPLIVDSFFLKRAETFMDEVLITKFKIKDYWFRVEYQHRGSPHIHGIVWIENAPDVSDILNQSVEEQQKIVEYFSKLVTAFHPNIDQPPSDIHPCQKRMMDVQDLDQDLAEILNKVQRHTKCSKDYCIRKNKKSQEMKCRFHFPQEYQDEAKLKIDESGNVEFLPKRNDDRLNKYNGYIIQTWRANIDVAPVISRKALINYLAKYISKSEHKSDHLAELMQIINQSPSQGKSAKHAVQRLYIKACAERDFSAQETCHLLMGLKLYSSGGRDFVSIGFADNMEWRLLKSDNTALSIFEKYEMRSEALDAKCLWDVVKCYEMPSERLRHKQAIVNIYPKYRENAIEFQSREKYYRQQVLLYVPWRNEKELKGNRSTWEETYNDYIDIIKLNTAADCNLHEIRPDEPEFEITEINNRQNVEEWMLLSGMGPSQNVQPVSLGYREIDTAYDWHESSTLYEHHGGLSDLQTFITRMKAENEATNVSSLNTNQVNVNAEQQKILDLLQLQINSLQEPSPNEDKNIPKTAIVQGKAGTGKSLVISKMTDLIATAFGTNSCLLLGPTGVSAVNINGSTIHSKLLIKIDEFQHVNGPQLYAFRKAMKNAKFIIIDEFSMVGCELLFKVDQRLRQAKDKPNEDFGGLFIYMFGDINQLPPVLDCSVYSCNQKSVETITGKILYDNFDTAFILEKIHRQSDERFQNVLNNISSGNITEDDYNFLKKRFTTAVTPDERKIFETVPHFFPTNKEKADFNFKILSSHKDPVTKRLSPVARIPSKASSKTAKNYCMAEDDGLEEILYLSKGSKIMLKTNLWTEKGLVNGSVGEVVDIVYDKNATPQEDPPAVLICKFASYQGPYLEPERKTIPIAPFQKTITNDAGEKYSLSQFPVCLNYACTIHKSQGLTVEKAYVDIGMKEMKPGLTYVALSRVKSIEGLLLEPFPYSRLLRINNSAAVKARQNWLTTLRAKQF